MNASVVAAPEEKKALWKNPFLIGFVVGVILLTALPILQRRMLRAPPPLASLPRWELPTATGGTLSSEALANRVWIAAFCALPCAEGVPKATGALPHLEDVSPTVPVVLFTLRPDAAPFQLTVTGDTRVPQRLVGDTSRFAVVAGRESDLGPVIQDGFRPAFAKMFSKDVGTTAADFMKSGHYALVDQRGDIRGFWVDDEQGRGNVINAARMLARYGPNP